MDDIPIIRSIESFEAFFQRDYRAVLGLAVVLSGSRSVAEDLTQDAFLAALRDWERVGRFDNPGAWVRRVVATKSTSVFRRAAAEARAILRLGSARNLELGNEIEKGLDVWRQVRRLPRRQAQVVALIYLHDLSRRDVAEILGCSEETVKTHLDRARRTLANLLTDPKTQMDVDDRLRRAAGEVTAYLAGTPIPPAPKRPRHGWPTVGLGALATLLVILGFAVLGGRQGSQPQVESSTTSSTPKSSALPLLAEPTDSVVYLTTDTQLTVVDVDSAVVTVHEIPEMAPGDPPYRVVSRGDRLVFYGGTETGPAVYALDPRESLTPVLIDEAWFFVPSADEDRVWLAILDPTSPDTVRALESVREVTVDGTVITDVPSPGGRWPVGALAAGLLFQGDSNLEVWDPVTQSLVENLPAPFPVAMWHNRIAICGSCSQLELFDLDADTHFVVDAPVESMRFHGYGGAFSPDGRSIAVPTHPNAAPITADTPVAVTLIEFGNGSTRIVPGSQQDQQSYPQVAWSPDGEWVFFYNGAAPAGTGQLIAYRPGDESAYRVAVDLDGPYYGMATGS
ncbi:MAG TPA: SigE family RNA polymerase sigma factor [Acidimicrobiia bacterium]|nr:SigE family RNA polymerase sigma factor [Acidimicrobiia bacterium]